MDREDAVVSMFDSPPVRERKTFGFGGEFAEPDRNPRQRSYEKTSHQMCRAGCDCAFQVGENESGSWLAAFGKAESILEKHGAAFTAPD